MSQTGPVSRAVPGGLRLASDLDALEIRRRVGAALEHGLSAGGILQEELRRALYLKTSVDPRRQQIALNRFAEDGELYQATVAFEGPPRGSRGLLMHGTVEVTLSPEGELALGRTEISFRVVDEKHLPAPTPAPRVGLMLVPPPPAPEEKTPVLAAETIATIGPVPSRAVRAWKAIVEFLS